MILDISTEFISSPVFMYLLFFLCATVFSIMLNGLLLKFSRTLGIRNHDETIIRWSEHSKPALGGIGFYIIFLLSVTTYGLFFSQGNFLINKELIGLLLATSLGFIMGLGDDAYNTKPLLKLGVQIACGLILAISGTYIDIFDNLIFNYLLTVLWVVGIMNSINMLDNMDAITTSVSIFIVASALVCSYLCAACTYIPEVMLVGVTAALFGFLFFNWNPSKMFMGDTGSQFLGTFLAALGIVFFWNHAGPDGEQYASKQVILVLLAFIIPIVDTTTVVINRFRRGQSPFVGGKDHTTHNLSYLGLSDQQVALVMLGFSLLSFVFIFVCVRYIENWGMVHVALFGGYFILVFGFLYGCTHLKRAKAKFNEQERRRNQQQQAVQVQEA